MRIHEDAAIQFIVNNFKPSEATLLTDSRFDKFLQLVKEGKEIAAAEEYQKLTDASLEECHLAATFAKSTLS